jgi:hypothetical protein
LRIRVLLLYLVEAICQGCCGAEEELVGDGVDVVFLLGPVYAAIEAVRAPILRDRKEDVFGQGEVLGMFGCVVGGDPA